MTTYTSVTVTHRGGLDAVAVLDRPLRDPEPGEARIRVITAPVCQDDVAIRIGNRPFLRKPPFVPGYAFIGVVDAVGEGVTDVSVGDRVTALTQFDSHAEVIYRPQGELAPVPDELDPVRAAPLVLNYLVAQQVLHRVAHVERGQSVLVIGASGGVGTAFLDLARLAGLRAYGTASPRKHPVVAGYGATPIDYRSGDLVAAVRRHEPDGVDLVVNGMGPEYLSDGLAALRRGGRLVAYGAPQGLGALAVLIGRLVATNVTPNGKRIIGYGTHREGVTSFKEDWATLFELLGRRQIEPLVAGTYPLRRARDAYARLESGSVAGTLVLTVP
ncbi:zinc-binding dehydrogenase [Actinotalea sp. M2MS4P-6]|uniref:zinc-binding dehydrogenase n=1 Tax=Actinotalea sp. M2MS4P-6 TaxID=2983762 RepID=UPI0021E3895C|nr:zinc-binding dehydrogenase [Actinotalea sp. M2MS4P-6]MCV2393304.1 zinc-binding dehydrogenase [Actinotalea sp. M2MS4P-6]